MKRLKELSFDKKIAIVSTIIAFLAVIIAAIGLIPQFKSSFSKEENKIHFTKNTSAKKIQSIVEDIAVEYFTDVDVSIMDLKDGSKEIVVTVYIYNDNKFDEESYILFSEKIYDMVFGNDSDIEMLNFDVVSHNGEVNIVGLEQSVVVPISMINIMRTTTLDNEEIWVSSLITSKQNTKKDIIINEYNKSEIFKSIDKEKYDLEKTHYFEDHEKFYDYEFLRYLLHYDFSTGTYKSGEDNEGKLSE